MIQQLYDELKRWERVNRASAHPIGILMLHYGKAFIFIYFGAVKAIYALTGFAEVPPVVSGTAVALNQFPLIHYVVPDPITFTVLVGVWEVLIGLCFVTMDTRVNKIGLVQLIVFHQPATFVPFLVAPALSYTMMPVLPTFSGLYILKNITLVAGGLILWHDVHEREQLKQSANTVNHQPENNTVVADGRGRQFTDRRGRNRPSALERTRRRRRR